MKNFWRATFARVGKGVAMQFSKKPSVPASQVGGLRFLLFVKQPLSRVIFSGNGSNLVGYVSPGVVLRKQVLMRVVMRAR
jgi:hypothetical protein